MTGEQVTAVFDRKPYVPVRVTVDDDNQFVLAARGRAVVTPDKLLAFVSDDPYAPAEARRLKIIPVARIRSIEDASDLPIR